MSLYAGKNKKSIAQSHARAYIVSVVVNRPMKFGRYWHCDAI